MSNPIQNLVKSNTIYQKSDSFKALATSRTLTRSDTSMSSLGDLRRSSSIASFRTYDQEKGIILFMIMI